MTPHETLGLSVFYVFVFVFIFCLGGQTLLSRRISHRIQTRHPQAWQVATRGFQEARISTKGMSFEHDIGSLGDPVLSFMSRLRLGMRIAAAMAVIGGLAWLFVEVSQG